MLHASTVILVQLRTADTILCTELAMREIEPEYSSVPSMVHVGAKARNRIEDIYEGAETPRHRIEYHDLPLRWEAGLV